MPDWTEQRHADAKKRCDALIRNDCGESGCPCCQDHRDMRDALAEIKRLQGKNVELRDLWRELLSLADRKCYVFNEVDNVFDIIDRAKAATVHGQLKAYPTGLMWKGGEHPKDT